VTKARSLFNKSSLLYYRVKGVRFFVTMTDLILRTCIKSTVIGGCIQLFSRIDFLRPRSWRRLEAGSSRKRFIEAARLALEKTDLYRARTFSRIDVYEWCGIGYPNAGALTESQVLLVSTEMLELIDDMPVELTAALLAHEFGHFRKHHGAVMSVFFTVIGTIYDSVAISLFPRVSPDLMFFVGLFASLEAGTLRWLSRRNEYEADAYAAAALGENNLILLFQKLSGVPLSLVKVQHALGLILIPSRLFRHQDRKLPFLARMRHFCRSGEWIPRSGGKTHPSLENRMLRLHQLKKERRERKKQEAAARKAFFHV